MHFRSVCVWHSVESRTGHHKQTGKKQASARKPPGDGLRKNRLPERPASRGRTMCQHSAPRRWRRQKDHQQDGPLRRKGFYAPGIVSWELDIYAPYSPPTGHSLTAPTSTGTGQRQSLQPAGQPDSPQQDTASRAKANNAQGKGQPITAAGAQPPAHSQQHSQQQPARRPAGAATSKRPRLIPTKRAHARIKTRPRPRRYSRRLWKDCGCGGAKIF